MGVWFKCFFALSYDYLILPFLQLYTQIAADIVGDNLFKICEEYEFLRFYHGVVQLALACAQAEDQPGHVNFDTLTVDMQMQLYNNFYYTGNSVGEGEATGRPH